MDNLQPLVLACMICIVAIYAMRWYTDPLRAIPAVGSSSLLGLSFVAVLHNVGDCRAMLEEGYGKARISSVNVLARRDTVEDIRKCPEEELSPWLGTLGALQLEYTCNHAVVFGYWQVNAATRLTQTVLPTILPEVIEEVALAARDYITTPEDDWTSVGVIPMIQKIVARTSNRAFVSLPLCRNEEYLVLAVDSAMDVMKAALALRLLPRFMKAVVAPLISRVEHGSSLTVSRLQPILEKRMKGSTELDDEDRNDLLQFFPKGELDLLLPNDCCCSVLPPSIPHQASAFKYFTISLTTLKLFKLSERRLQTVSSSDGWTSAARKLDSILRETLRYDGMGLHKSVYSGLILVTTSRMAMKDITLRDGTRIPKGTMVSVNMHAQRQDNAPLEDADTFDAFRYACMRSAEGQSQKNRLTTTSPDYISFGVTMLAPGGTSPPLS